MSMMTCVVSVTYTDTAPATPAATSAEFATTLPSNEFNVEAFGRADPVGHSVRYPSDAVCGTTVTFNE